MQLRRSHAGDSEMAMRSLLKIERKSCCLDRCLPAKNWSTAITMGQEQTKAIIGWRETISLPDLKLVDVLAKIDTGARTTALHATGIKELMVNEAPWVEFYPNHQTLGNTHPVVAPVLHRRDITNTSGVPETRLVIATLLCIGDRKCRIEVSLTNRSGMKFPVILGRSAIRQLGLNVNPSRSWLQTNKPAFTQTKDQS